MKPLIIVFGLVFLSADFQANAATESARPTVTTVPNVDLQKYLGCWFEIAAIPQFFEKKCVGNVTAEYANAEQGLIAVTNTCDTKDGTPSLASCRAKVVDTVTNAKLKVTFVKFFGWKWSLGGDYWILGLGENYSYAVIGAPGRDYAWILSRTASMTKEQIAEAHQTLLDQGFDTCQLISTVQKSGIQIRAPLCKLVSGL